MLAAIIEYISAIAVAVTMFAAYELGMHYSAEVVKDLVHFLGFVSDAEKWRPIV